MTCAYTNSLDEVFLSEHWQGIQRLWSSNYYIYSFSNSLTCQEALLAQMYKFNVSCTKVAIINLRQSKLIPLNCVQLWTIISKDRIWIITTLVNLNMPQVELIIRVAGKEHTKKVTNGFSFHNYYNNHYRNIRYTKSVT